jgi:hypothetical protein
MATYMNMKFEYRLVSRTVICQKEISSSTKIHLTMYTPSSPTKPYFIHKVEASLQIRGASMPESGSSMFTLLVRLPLSQA